jgi:hypothetical protein
LAAQQSPEAGRLWATGTGQSGAAGRSRPAANAKHAHPHVGVLVIGRAKMVAQTINLVVKQPIPTMSASAKA